MTYDALFLKELFEYWQPTDNGILLRFIPEKKQKQKQTTRPATDFTLRPGVTVLCYFGP